MCELFNGIMLGGDQENQEIFVISPVGGRHYINIEYCVIYYAAISFVREVCHDQGIPKYCSCFVYCSGLLEDLTESPGSHKSAGSEFHT